MRPAHTPVDCSYCRTLDDLRVLRMMRRRADVDVWRSGGTYHAHVGGFSSRDESARRALFHAWTRFMESER